MAGIKSREYFEERRTECGFARHADVWVESRRMLDRSPTNVEIRNDVERDPCEVKRGHQSFSGSY